MYDATAKIPSGLLNGNINQFGDFDECIGIQGSEGIQGQYCLAYLHLKIDESRIDLRHLHRLVHSHYAFKSNITDVSMYFSKPQNVTSFYDGLNVVFAFKNTNI